MIHKSHEPSPSPSLSPEGECGGGESRHLPIEAAGEEETTQDHHGNSLDDCSANCDHLQEVEHKIYNNFLKLMYLKNMYFTPVLR